MYRLTQALTFYRSGDSAELVTIPAGTVVSGVMLVQVDPWNREAFKLRIKRDKEEGYPRGALVVFRYADGWRGAYASTDLERMP
jgi:hypothetical protein